MCTILLQEENTEFKLPLSFVCWLGYDIDDNPSINLAFWFSEIVSIYFSKDEIGKGVRHVLMNSSTAWALVAVLAHLHLFLFIFLLHMKCLMNLILLLLEIPP